MLLLLLRDHLTRIELYQHGTIGFKLLHGDREPKVVQKKELKLEMIELYEREASDLRTERSVTIQ